MMDDKINLAAALQSFDTQPSGTTNTGDVHEEIPDHIETTTGKVVS